MNNIRDNITKMSTTELHERNALVMNYLDNAVSRMNAQDRIEADKYIEELRQEFQRQENDKDRHLKADTVTAQEIGKCLRLLASIGMVGVGVFTANPVLVYAGAFSTATSVGGYFGQSNLAIGDDIAGYLPG